MLSSKLINILACPACKEALTPSSGKLKCSRCDTEFKIIKDKIPCFLDNDPAGGNSSSEELVSRHFYRSGIGSKLIGLGSKIITSEFRVNKKIFDKAISGIDKNAVVIEVGAGKKKLLPQSITLDVFPFDSVDIVCDAHSMPLKDQCADFVLLDNVLEHVKKPWQVADESCRILKDGGKILCVAPFIHHFHAYPDDYFRFTSPGLQSLFDEKMDILETDLYGGPSVAIVSTVSEYATLYTFSRNKLLNAAVRALVLVFLFLFKFLDCLLVKNKLSTKVCSTLVLVAQKKKTKNS